MSSDSFPEPTEAELADLTAMLGDDAVWASPSPDVEDRVKDAIAAVAAAQPSDKGRFYDSAPLLMDDSQPFAGEATAPSALQAADPALRGSATGAPDNNDGVGADPAVVDLSERRSRRVKRSAFLLASAAALIAVAVAGFALFRDNGLGSTDLGTTATVTLSPTEYDPGASATAYVSDLQNGAQLILDISGLDPAPEGFLYHVWLVRPEPRNVISAGTFHMRGNDEGKIEFWAGVPSSIYNEITVTLHSEADPTAPGELILKGKITP